MDDKSPSDTQMSWDDVCNKVIIIPDVQSSASEISKKARDMVTCISHIQTQISVFWEVFRVNIDPRPVLTASEMEYFRKRTFQFADAEGYKGGTIAEAFHRAAGDEGLLTLIIFTRYSRNLLRQWKNISENCRLWVIRKAVELLKRHCMLELPPASQMNDVPLPALVPIPSSIYCETQSNSFEHVAKKQMIAHPDRGWLCIISNCCCTPADSHRISLSSYHLYKFYPRSCHSWFEWPAYCARSTLPQFDRDT